MSREIKKKLDTLSRNPTDRCGIEHRLVGTSQVAMITDPDNEVDLITEVYENGEKPNSSPSDCPKQTGSIEKPVKSFSPATSISHMAIKY